METLGINSFVIRILIVIIVVILAYAIWIIIKKADDKEVEERKRALQIEEHNRLQIKLQKKEENERRLRKINEYETAYGECTKVISNPNNSNCDFIRVYEKQSIILINEAKYGFDEIIGFKLTDNSRVIKGDLSSSTSTSNTSAIGRAVVGAALGGVAGAVIGGTTAKQNTQFKQGEDKTIHDYTVNINVNRLSEPLIMLHVGNNEGIANEIAALINAIVVRNKVKISK